MSAMGYSELRDSELSDAKSASASFDPDARVEQASTVRASEVKVFSPDERIEQVAEHHGGSYRDLFIDGRGEYIEIHHVPANEVNGLERNDGPCIEMDKCDHKLTASWGMSREARDYRAKQRELIEAGYLNEALKMDIVDLQREEFNHKYDEALHEAANYAEQMGYIPNQEGLWDGKLDS